MPRSRHLVYLERLPQDWDIVPVEVLGEVRSGSTPSRRVPHFWNGDIPWLTPGETTTAPHKWLTGTRELITKAGLKHSAATLLPRGSIMVTTRATLGNVVLASTATATNQGFKNIVPTDGVNPEFYYYLFRFIAAELVRLSSGTTFLEISGSEFKRILVPRPEGTEQLLIAGVLDAIDAAIQKTDAVTAKLKRMRAGLLHDLYDFRSGDAMLHFSPLGECCQLFTGGTPNRGRPEFWAGDIPWIKTGEIDYGDIFAAEESISREGLQRSSAKIAPPGAILLALYGQGQTRGKVARLRIKAAINQACAAIVPAPETDADFIYFYLVRQYEALRKLARGGNQENLNSGIVRRFPIPLPSKTIQHSVARALNAFEDRIDLETRISKKLWGIKHGLMHDLLTGRVRVPVQQAALQAAARQGQTHE